MSDDLISRQATYKAFSDYLNRNFIGEVSSQTELSIGEIASVIKSIPTAFDKEKVIEELRRKYEKSMDIYDVDKKFNPECASKGIADAYKTTLDVVKKGGIE